MPLPQSLRSLIPLAIGLVVGGAGAVLFIQSMPGSEGSPEERAAKLEVELKKTKNQLAAYQDTDPSGRRKSGKTLKDGLRDLEEDLIAGRPVTPDDIFRASQPLIRALSPMLDRVRIRQQKHMIESMCGEISRKYSLSTRQQASLKEWFESRSEEKAKEWSALVSRDGTRIEDLIRSSRDERMDDGLDSFMSGMLSGDKLAKFQTERMAEKAERVQQQADAKTERLDTIVKLDDAQRDKVFAIMARGSRDFDPAMKLEGMDGEIGAVPSGNVQQAMLSVLTPEQRTLYQAERTKRRDEAVKELESFGLSLPPDWDLLDESDF